MLQLFPFATLLAAGTSLVLLVMLLMAGELRLRSGLACLVIFLAAGCCQFLSSSAALAVAGLAVQTLLAIGLIVRWRSSV